MSLKRLKAILWGSCKPAINEIKEIGVPFLDKCSVKGIKIAIVYGKVKYQRVQRFRAHTMN